MIKEINKKPKSLEEIKKEKGKTHWAALGWLHCRRERF